MARRVGVILQRIYATRKSHLQFEEFLIEFEENKTTKLTSWEPSGDEPRVEGILSRYLRR